jgi:GDPmannose 4,6-dehydratase
MKKALITGVTGQDGAYLADFLLEKGYEVHGLVRRSSILENPRINHLKNNVNFHLHFGDMSDTLRISNIIKKHKPDEVYNLAAQSHVGISFDQPEYTSDIDGLGALRILDSIKLHGLKNKTKFYQASTSELFGQVQESPQKETTPFYPKSPYGVAKLYAYWITVNYREAYGMFACNGILFNHESKLRGEEFVTRKITRALSRIKLGLQDSLVLGNLDAMRDWGHAIDFVRAQWLILQHKKADDFVISTGKQYSVRFFIELCLESLDINVKWVGDGLNECAIDDSGKTIVKVDTKYFRPSEVETLLGDSTKALNLLNWKPEIQFDMLVKEMVDSDLNLAKKELSDRE